MKKYNTKFNESPENEQQIMAANHYQQSKRYLIDDPTTFSDALAEKIGLNEAIFLQKLHNLTKKSNNIHEGLKWVYNTTEDWREYFPYWSKDTIVRITNSLRKKNLIVVGNFNKKGYDRTLWYRVDYIILDQIEGRILCLEGTDKKHANCINGFMQNAYTYTTNETLTKRESKHNPSLGSKPKARVAPPAPTDSLSFSGTKSLVTPIRAKTNRLVDPFSELDEFQVYELVKNMRVYERDVYQVQREFIDCKNAGNSYGAKSTLDGVRKFLKAALSKGTISSIDDSGEPMYAETEIENANPIGKHCRRAWNKYASSFGKPEEKQALRELRETLLSYTEEELQEANVKMRVA